ncbi:MAG: hypothetical protein NC341_04530 [Blautia sp.]|nr:hypothetical protein [Blautia sp.]MCM1200903.1 hypothetical protein [Bacteroides fragilis]
MKGSTAFQRIVIIGYGKITGEIITYVMKRREEYGYRLEAVEHEAHSLSITEKLCREAGVPFARIENKKELAAYLDSFSEKTLIVSASNNFLFPKPFVEKENITIVNFHNALLPAYPGRNAPSWAIFMGEKETGVTWHYVTAGVDEGNIIVQKRCEIGADTKAYELAEQLMELARAAFTECFDAVLAERAEARPQRFDEKRRMYRSCETPADGFFKITEEPERIYRLLRSMDYGKNGIFQPARTVIDGKRAEVLRYRKIAGEKREAEGFLFLPLADGNLLKIKYRML